jgi:succinyl-diaminopimelate desuccinylase
MEDEISGNLTLAFSLLKVTDTGLEGTFDSRCPVCSNEENVLMVVKKNMEDKGFTLHNDSMRPPHHVDGNSDFVKTLLNAYESYTGRKGECISMGGGTYVHDLKNGVAFGASMPETDNRMHGADEFAVVEELVVSAKIFAQVIVDLCS